MGLAASWPATVQLAAGVVAASVATTFVIFCPFVSAPKPIDSFESLRRTFPSATSNVARSTFHVSAARSINSSRAAAATRWS